MAWIQGQRQADRDRFILWLYGPAGSGKSAIAQTIAEWLHEQKMLLASYFFGRLDPSRNHSRSLIPTIAYQMACRLPEVREQITRNVDQDNLIFTRCLEAQIESLVIDPLESLIKSGYFIIGNSARVIIIDGLDECVDRQGQEEILRSLSVALQKHRLPIRFLICSRPELEIKASFNSDTLKHLSARLALENDYWVVSDIERFLSNELENIRQTHSLTDELPSGWPTSRTIRHLIEKCSGQFIYASTVVNFVKSPRHRPDDRLDVILGLRRPGKDLPFAELNALYHHLFSSVEDWEKASLILAFCILRGDSSCFTIAAIETLLGLRPGDCRISLCDLGSIIDLDNANSRIAFFHASVQDFLLDKTRSNDFYIDPTIWHAKFTRILLQFFPDSCAFHWKTEGMHAIDLRILGPHIEQDPSLEVLEGQILDFDILQFFKCKFPANMAYSIPDYLTMIKKSQLRNAEVIYRKQNDVFSKHVEAELTRYCERPCLDFFLHCLAHDSKVFSSDGVRFSNAFRSRMHDSLSLEDLWIQDVYSITAYTDVLQAVSKHIISEQTVALAALYALKEVTMLLTQQTINKNKDCDLYSRARFFLQECERLLKKAGRSADLMDCAKDLPMLLILEQNPWSVRWIDTAAHDYLTRMRIASKQDYAALAHRALIQLSELAALEETECYIETANDAPSTWCLLKSLEYLLEKAGRCEVLINYLDNLALPFFLNQDWLSVERIDAKIQRYHARVGIPSNLDYASVSRRAVTRVPEVAIKTETSAKAIDDLECLVSSCEYLLRKTVRSKELIDFVQHYRLSLLDVPLCEFDRLNTAIDGYLTRVDIPPNPDHTSSSLALYALQRFSELIPQYMGNPAQLYWTYNSVYICKYLLEKAGWSKELFSYTLPARFSSKYKHCRYEIEAVEDAINEYRERVRRNNRDSNSSGQDADQE